MILNVDNMPVYEGVDKIVLAGKLTNPAKYLPEFPKTQQDFLELEKQSKLPSATPQFVNWLWRMVRASLKYDGLGLAANQIGIDKRVFIIQEDEKTFRTYIHPSYSVSPESTLNTKEEGCLSVPKYTFQVPRNTKILASWFEFDENQQLVFKQEVLEDMQARVFQHELDHLNGQSIIDKASNINRSQKRELLRAIR